VGGSERWWLCIWHIMLDIIIIITLCTYSTYMYTCTQAVFKSPPFAHHITYSPTENDVYLLMNRVIQFVFFSPARIFLQKEFDHMPSTMIKRFFISIPFVVITRTKCTHTTHTHTHKHIIKWKTFFYRSWHKFCVK